MVFPSAMIVSLNVEISDVVSKVSDQQEFRNDLRTCASAGKFSLRSGYKIRKEIARKCPH